MSQEEIERRIADLARQRGESVQRSLSMRGPDGRFAQCCETRRIEDERGELYRRLATEHGVEVVVPLRLGFVPDANVSSAVVLQSEYDGHVFFRARRTDREGTEGVAVVRFFGDSKFGGLNDEALVGHPLWSRGLLPYDCGEVLNSSWSREEDRRNRVAFPKASGAGSLERHLIFTFHDSTFECLSSKTESEFSDRSMADLFEERARAIRAVW